MRTFLQKFSFAVLVIAFAAPSATAADAAPARPQFWPEQCVDTMKYSRDAAREWLGRKDRAALAEQQVASVASLGASCVAVATPYNQEFVPVLQAWVAAARAHNLKVWFRGNRAEWEGWFGYPKYKDPSQHHADVAKFIEGNPSLFEAGDIFTPAPEAENGVLGNPWRTFEARGQLRDFVVKSYDSCRKAFSRIQKPEVRCGYFSTNGDVGREIFTADTAQKTGGVLAVDHYVKDPQRVVRDAVAWAEADGARAALGEFGAPIPDIHGAMTEDQQAAYLEILLTEAVRQRGSLAALNYWTLSGGSTALLRPDGSEKPAAATLRKFYSPGAVAGSVTDDTGVSQPGALLVAGGSGVERTEAGEGGAFNLPLLAGSRTVNVSLAGFRSKDVEVAVVAGQAQTLNVSLVPDKASVAYWFRKFLQNLRLR